MARRVDNQQRLKYFMMTTLLPPVGDTYARDGANTLGDTAGNSGYGFGNPGQQGFGNSGSDWSDKSSSGFDPSGSGS